MRRCAHHAEVVGNDAPPKRGRRGRLEARQQGIFSEGLGGDAVDSLKIDSERGESLLVHSTAAASMVSQPTLPETGHKASLPDRASRPTICRPPQRAWLKPPPTHRSRGHPGASSVQRSHTTSACCLSLPPAMLLLDRMPAHRKCDVNLLPQLSPARGQVRPAGLPPAPTPSRRSAPTQSSSATISSRSATSPRTRTARTRCRRISCRQHRLARSLRQQR